MVKKFHLVHGVTSMMTVQRDFISQHNIKIYIEIIALHYNDTIIFNEVYFATFSTLSAHH